MILLNLSTFLGRLHPMIVHLPIGFLLLGALFHALSYIPKYQQLKAAVTITLLIGFLSAVAACVFGYLLSLSGEYDAQTLSNHKTSGILLAVLAGLLWSMTTSFYSRFLAISNRAVAAVCAVVVILMAYTGHQGANLTHGSDYLSLQTLTHQERAKPETPQQAMIFEDVVQPLLEKRCQGCHNAKKRKGELMVTSWEALMKGGKSGPAVIAGKPQDSELYRRITLDPAHEEFMPTDGKTPLTKEETHVIQWWIETAQAAQQKKLADLQGHEAILPEITAVLTGRPSESRLTSRINPSIPSTVNMAAVESLRAKGLVVRIMLHEPVILDVTIPAQSGIAMTTIEEEMGIIARNIIWLNVSDNNLREGDLTVLTKMTNLEKLRLEKNPITDEINSLLAKMEFLTTVNLNETQLSNEGLKQLKKKPSVKRIYTWKTAVTHDSTLSAAAP
jgi:uncharacterized membrane protein